MYRHGLLKTQLLDGAAYWLAHAQFFKCLQFLLLLIWFLGGVTHRKKETRQTAYLLVNTTHEGYAAKADAGHGKPKSAPQEVIHKMKP
ncbi:hypothetical protein HMPREF1991_02434 [Hoylesella loescheii DSM 19665 = JCM 12249 = ATCC 15930]|uniref:Uncharacterized protein n=1 Tax=Hoylesella loescheii DSM 19665 = JCM 12249 = ATCC 15930 TaxID=1122985 RepID=A0A069QFP1_HOYLO|nr:hypothetical protein HMPREF1991_02434 [Hoylesella loescheii DSM 19665 = JCM 12249 = ATCC 15930]